MPRFAANLSMMFTDVPFLDRFEAAARAGFTAVEFLFPYDHPAEEVGKRLKRNGLTQALFNLPPGNWDAGEKGFAALPARFEGIFRKHMLVRDGELRDSAWYAIVDDDWPEVRANLERRLARPRRP